MRLTRVACVCSALLFLCEQAGAQFLFTTNSTWHLRKGQSEASAPVGAWRAPAFDDATAGFSDAPSPFWYGDPYNAGTVLGDMLNSYTCIFLRKTFVITNTAEVAGLRLNALVDDGFVAWINGTEVARVNVTDASPTYQTLAANYNEPVPFVEYPLPTPSGYLVLGTNVIAIQAFNTSLGSTDFGFNASLRMIPVDPVPPTIAMVAPAAGSTVTQLTQVAVIFSEEVQGVNADDLLVNGISAMAVSQSGNTYTFTFPQPAFYGEVTMTWAETHGITDFAEPPNVFAAAGPGATWNYALEDRTPPSIAGLFPPAAVVVRALSQVEVTFSEAVTGVEAADVLMNGTSATNVVEEPGARFIFQFAPVSPGNVAVEFRAAHGITDLAAVPNAFPGALWNYIVDPNATTGDLVITEINAANENGLVDEDGQQQDWIEIWNRGPTTVNLARWSLSDDASQPGYWEFPARTLAPNAYLVVFASGKDRRSTSTASNLHTSFNLSGSGEFLGLYAPESPRPFVSGFASGYPVQRNDFSFGYDTNGQLRYFAAPTPGAPNGGSSIIGVCQPVHFSASRGFYSQAFDLALSCETAGAVIRYTTDGSEPTLENGSRYSGPLRIAATTLLRAAAFRGNLLPSQTVTHTYFFNLSVSQRSLPVISIVTAETNMTGPFGIIGISNVMQQGDGTYVPRDATGYHNPSKHGLAWERPVSVEFLDNRDGSALQADCGIRVQGSDYQRPRTTTSSKFSFRLYFRGDYGAGRLNHPLFPLSSVTEFDQVVLRAGFNDNANPFIRDELTRRLSHDMGNVASHGSLAVLFVNGVYKGFYNPCERVHEEMMQSHLGGSDEWDIVGPSFAQGSGAPGVIDGDRSSFASLVNYVNQNNPATPVIYDEIGRRLDLQNFVDYCLLNVYSGMGDWPGNNWRAGKDRGPGGIWRFIVWDGEWAMGIYSRVVTRDTFAENGPGPDNSGLASTGNSEIAQLYQRLRASPEFRLLWADRIHKHMFNGGALTDAHITNRFHQLRMEMTGVLPSMALDIVNIWVPQRRGIIFGHFDNYGLMASSNAPVFSQHGGRVSGGYPLAMQATNGGGTIYYTTDGTDPRAKHSGVPGPTAMAYSVPVTLNRSTLVKARTLLSGNWSALAEAHFTVASAGVPVRITELNYNPPEGAQYEFIEISNMGGAPVDLSGMTFDGVTFTFLNGSVLAPGAVLVLASDRNPAAFGLKYPGVEVAGYFGGSLDNAGERIALKDTAGDIVTSVDYSDAFGWPVAADGGGKSLVVIDPLGDPDDPANWLASITSGGTPGVVTPITPAIVRLNEVMADNITAVNNGGAYPDWVELHNAGSSPVNIGGWSVTDDSNARKYVFPAGTVVAAGGYLVIWCDAITNTTPGLHAGFALDRDSDRVLLYDANTNRVDGLSFGPQIADSSMGRIEGEWQLTQPTPNASNVAAAVAPQSDASINEWLANPTTGQSDWLEVFNRSTLPLALQGMYLGTTGLVHRINALAYVPAGGFIQLFCDENPGWNHLDFKLPAAGGHITLLDSLAVEMERVAYPAQVEGVSRGRLPDGSSIFANFTGSASPGASNYVIDYTGPVINEILARNRSAVTNATTGRVADFVELYNGGGAPFNVGGMSLSVDEAQAGQFVFPPNTLIPANGYLTVWCDDGLPMAATAAPFNTGRALRGEGGGVYLFSGAGQVVNFMEYGFQVPDESIGRVSGTIWRLLITPTPGQTNAPIHPLGNISMLRINEWMANPASGDDWLEIYNPTNLPIDLGGLLLADDPSFLGTNGATRFAPLSYIPANGFVQVIADGIPSLGPDHASFALHEDGETIRLYRSDGLTLIDSVTYGVQYHGVSAGRLPDGSSNNVVTFFGSASPGESNYELLSGVVVSEFNVRSAPGTQWIELHNRGSATVNLGGWYLSDSQQNFRKFRIPSDTILAPGAFLVVNEAQFASGPPTVSFRLNRHAGGEIWLSAADAAGALTGVRTSASYGGALSDGPFGRVENAAGVDYAVMAQATPGAANAAPLVGPVIVSEIMYNPESGDDEFIELRNGSGAAVALYDLVRPTNTWRLNDAVNYTFPQNVTIAAGGYLLVVGFDPANVARLSAFQARHAIPAGTPVFGPWVGNLNNGGDNVELVRPNDSFTLATPYTVTVDRVSYDSEAPWPSGGADGGGLSLQRRNSAAYGNDPENWVTDIPTPRRDNTGGAVPPPEIAQAPSDVVAYEGTAGEFAVNAAGSGPLGYQWRFNGIAIPEATNAALAFDYAVEEMQGEYDVVVSNPSGVAVSTAARLVVAVPPELLAAPVSVVVPTNAVAQLIVSARGSQPLAYEWRQNGVLVPGEIGPVLRRSPARVDDTGDYEVTVANAYGSVTASAMITVTMPISHIVPPQSQTVTPGEIVTLSTVVTGSPAPFNFVWLRGVATRMVTNYPAHPFDFYTFTAPNVVTSFTFRVLARNSININGTASPFATINVVADTDGDGIADFWETDHGFNPNDGNDRAVDADGDGLSNYDEYRAGTNPTNALSYLKVSMPILGDGASLSFGALSNRTYTVEFISSLGDASGWQRLMDVPALTSNRTERIVDATATTNRFYRIVTPWRPQP